ncbi:2-iminoacetate synthase ThiH [Sedimenticola thiotaurini]|uniref:Thiamine biosynthesis protein ThiH n=1 Tax=Sedimenticola thiotaurini TaxID=1543721 RepID=A0A0F7JUX2_9GAMM|nr:2-iminoacetate synthase ThiH [Sedimenticola thiotaurini]AKH19084.1 thiamine biosynthesis protein ThiH [Sedimenticola thiotaurini]
MSFLSVFEQHTWEGMAERINGKQAADVERALDKPGKRDLDDFCALISPAATPYLERMAQLSYRLTRKRFGNTTQLYIPMYLSNECHNICTYCGFSVDNKLKRRTLTREQVLQEVEAIKAHRFEHLLMVTGEAHRTVGVDYLEQALEWVRPHFSSLSLEVQALDQADYERLIKKGLDSVLLYQETYHRDNYRQYHPKGKKRNFEYRLETPDRLGRAGIHRIGLGALLGLEDWRTDAAFVALHLGYLERRYWQTKYSISLPRLRPAEGVQSPNVVVTDRDFVQMICAYRIYSENVEISLSTRERPEFRDHLLKLGITSMSAGSKTEPGGYAIEEEALEQFEISDDRSVDEVVAMIRRQGFDPVWKDWDSVLG